MDVTSKAVSVLGIGSMGAALARALLIGGYRVTVWNRTKGKCASLADLGAHVADTVADAVDASDVIVMCVANVDAVAPLIQTHDVAERLRGKTLVQLTTRTPREAKDGAAWASQHGIAFLEGAIQGYPCHIGTPEGSIVYAGSEAVYEANTAILRCLGGQPVFVSENIGSASALDLSLAGTFIPGAVMAFLHGAAICEAEGAPIKTYLELVERALIPGLLVTTLRTSEEMIARGDYAFKGEGAPIDAWVGGLELVGKAVRDAGVEIDFHAVLMGYLRKAVTDGRGQDEMPVVFEYFRKKVG